MSKRLNKAFKCLLITSLISSNVLASPLIIKTDSNTISTKAEVSILKNNNLKFDSMDLYQNDTYIKTISEEQSKTKQVVDLLNKSTVIKGVLNNPSIDNSDAELSILPSGNSWLGVDEGSVIDWRYVFTGLGSYTSYEWVIDQYGSDGALIGSKAYKNTQPPNSLTDGVYLATLKYTDEFNKEFKATQLIKVGNSGNSVNNEESFKVKQVSCGALHTLLLMEDGSVYATGYNVNGQLGVGDTTDRQSFERIDTLGTGVASIHTGYYANFAIMKDGSVKAWGSNSFNMLGVDSDEKKITTPQDVELPNKKAIKVDCMDASNIILMKDGTIYSCGGNKKGQLGLGDTTDVSKFTQIKSLGENVVDIACGIDCTYVTLKDGNIYCFGSNSYGQLAVSSTGSILTPTKTRYTTSTVLKISPAYFYTLLLKVDGTVEGYGYNTDGQLGNGTITNTEKPTNVIGLNGRVVDLYSKYMHTVAKMEDGSLVAWGRGGYGGLGDSYFNSKNSTPVKPIISYKGISQINLGYGHSTVLLDDGRVVLWGENKLGQLGLNHKQNTNIPLLLDKEFILQNK